MPDDIAQEGLRSNKGLGHAIGMKFGDVVYPSNEGLGHAIGMKFSDVVHPSNKGLGSAIGKKGQRCLATGRR